LLAHDLAEKPQTPYPAAGDCTIATTSHDLPARQGGQYACKRPRFGRRVEHMLEIATSISQQPAEAHG